MRYLSVASGIEAVSVAWEPLGYKPVLFSDIDRFPRAVLRYRQNARPAQRGVRPGKVPLWGDFTTIRKQHLERLGIDTDIDVLVGGTPCQSFSVAGLRGGMDDERGNLALEFLVLARRFRPRWVLWENVPGVLSSNGGRDFGSFLGGLEELGYGFAYRVLDAQYVRVDGYPRAVPQRRRRVFVVGHSGGDWRRAAAVLFERESLSGHPAPRRKAGQNPAGTLGARTGRSIGTQDAGVGHLCAEVASVDARNNVDRGDSQHLERLIAERPGVDYTNLLMSPEVSGTLEAAQSAGNRGHGVLEPVAHSLRGEGFDASEDGTGRGTPLVPTIGFGWQNAAAQGDDVREECSPTLDKSKTPAIAFDWKMGGKAGSAAAQEELSPTLSSGADRYAVAMHRPISPTGHQGDTCVHAEDAAICLAAGGGNNGGGGGQVLYHPQMAVRRLTPTECERLQGFPDGYTRIPYRGKGPEDCPDGPRYKALGNSMAVNVMRWLGLRMHMVDAIPAADADSEAA